MPYANWDEALSVGIGAIDADHKQLLAIINELHDRLARAKASAEELEAGRIALERMEAYGAGHFSREEERMERTGFPEFSRHCRLHQEFLDKLGVYRSQLAEGYVPVREVLAFLKRWLMGHIMVQDQVFGRYVKDEGLHVE